MQEVVETLRAETRWGHPWEGGEGAGVELAIPKGCGATHSQGQFVRILEALIAQTLSKEARPVQPHEQMI
jgi:hypothetical protein